MKHVFTVVFSIALFFPLQAGAFIVSGWMPYWSDESAIDSAEDNLSKLDRVYPFVYEVNARGEIVDRADLDERQWERFFKKTDRADIETIPTIAWFDGAKIHETLSDDDKREAHVEEIVKIVEDGDFAGINIDYESRLAETIDYYSLFLKELKDELGRNLLTCTLETRTPVDSRYRDVPGTLKYSNDYKEIARHCDYVELMAYDQQRIDWKLNDQASGQPYIPVADPAWVEKVVKLTLEHIPKEKLILGIPTYGRVWELEVAPNWFKGYQSVRAGNPEDFTALRKKYGVKSHRNSAGERSFSYFPEDSIFKVLSVLPVPAGTPRGNEAAQQALLFANYTGMTVPVNVAWYGDEQSVKDKLDLVKKYDLAGVALFKIDGKEDSDIWDLF